MLCLVWSLGLFWYFCCAYAPLPLSTFLRLRARLPLQLSQCHLLAEGFLMIPSFDLVIPPLSPKHLSLLCTQHFALVNVFAFSRWVGCVVFFSLVLRAQGGSQGGSGCLDDHGASVLGSFGRLSSRASACGPASTLNKFVD